MSCDIIYVPCIFIMICIHLHICILKIYDIMSYIFIYLHCTHIYVHVYMGWWFSFVLFDFIVVGFIKRNPKNVIQTNKIIWHQQAKYHNFQTFQYTYLLHFYDILILNKRSQSNTKNFNTYTLKTLLKIYWKTYFQWN